MAMSYNMKSLNDVNDYLDSHNDPYSVLYKVQQLEDYPNVDEFSLLQLPNKLMCGLVDFLKCERPTRLSAILLSLIAKSSHHPLLAQTRRCLHKDIAIVVGMLQRIDKDFKGNQVLYVCPTDAVAVEMIALVKKISHHTDITSALLDIYNYHSQSLNSQFIIGTWDSLNALFLKGKLQTSTIRMVVFDELDHALTLNSEEENSQMVRLIGSMKAQVLIFYSAVGNSVSQAASVLLCGARPNYFFWNPEEHGLTRVQQFKIIQSQVSEPFEVKTGMVVSKIMPLIDRNRRDMQIIIFVNKKRDQKKLYDALFHEDWDVRSPSLARGGKSECLYDFMCGEARILLASECLPRGFDMSTPKVIIFLDIPVKSNGEADFKTYRYFTSKVGLLGSGMTWALTEGEEERDLIDSIERKMDLPIRQVEEDDLQKVFLEVVV